MVFKVLSNLALCYFFDLYHSSFILSFALCQARFYLQTFFLPKKFTPISF